MKIKFIFFFSTIILLSTNKVWSTVKVTPASTSTISLGSGCQMDIGTMKIDGVIPTDFTAGSKWTYRIKLPNGFKFAGSAGNISVVDNYSSPLIGAHSFSPDKTEFEFQYDIPTLSSGTFNLTITISNINVQCLIPGSYGDIHRISSTNMGNMVGNAPGDKQTHGFLDARVFTPIVADVQTHVVYLPYYDYYYNIANLKSSSPLYTRCTYSTNRYEFKFKTAPSFPSNITEYYLYEGNKKVATSTTNLLDYTPALSLDGTFNYTIVVKDDVGCLYGSMDTIDIQNLESPPPADFIPSDPDPTKTPQHDTIFSKDADPKLLNGYMEYPDNSPYEVTSYSGSSAIENIGSGSYLFSPSLSQTGNFPIYYTATTYYTNTTTPKCNSSYRMPYNFTVYDPSQAPADWVTIIGPNQAPFCENEGDIKFRIDAPSGKYIKYLYFRNPSTNSYEYHYNYPPLTATGYPSNNTTTYYTVNTLQMKAQKLYSIAITVIFANQDGTGESTYPYPTTNISIFPKRDVKISGFPKPISGSSSVNDSTFILCGSTKDTLYVRFTPENGRMEYYSVQNNVETLLGSPLGVAQDKNDPFFRKMVPSDLFKKIAKGDTSIHFKIKYKYPGSNYNSQCPDSIIRRIKFNMPIEVKDTIVSPSKPPYCLNEALQIVLKYPSNATHSINDRFIWNFGDGLGDIVDSSTTLHHSFGRPGKYVLRFKTNLYSLPTGACNNDLIDTLRIGAKPIADFDIYQNFKNKEAVLISRGDIAVLNPAATIADPDTIFSWYWDLGNGTQLTKSADSLHFTFNNYQRNPFKMVHVVKSGWGCVDTIIKYTPIFDIKSPTNSQSYFESFNDVSKANSWYASGWYKRDTLLSSWENEPADGNKIKADTNSASWNTSAYSVDNSSAKNKSYIVTYQNKEISWVESPVFNLSNLDLPMVSFTDWANSDVFDGASFQYAICDSVAFGKEKWVTLGSYNTGLNWYNSYSVVSAPGGSYNGWTADTAKQWQLSAYRLNSVKDSLVKYNKSFVRFRIIFAGNGDNSLDHNYDGFSFDNFFVGERNRRVIVEEFCDMTHSVAGTDKMFADPQGINIQYHINSLANDTIYNQHPADPSARALYYGIGSALPRGVIDGILENNDKDFSIWGENDFFKRSLITSSFSINMDPLSVTNGKLNIHATVSKLPNTLAIKNPLIVHVAVLDSKVTVPDVNNNPVSFLNVLRNYLPNSAGNRVDKSVDLTTTPYDVTHTWQPFHKPDSAVIVVVFVQDENTKEIYQSQKMTLSAADANFLTQAKTAVVNAAFQPSFNEMYIAPNPTSGDLKVMLNGIAIENYTWRVLDELGMEVKSGEVVAGTNALFIHTDELRNGMYVLSMEGEGQRIIKKFSVIR